MRYLVTGSAGFIGFHLARRLLNDGHEVIGLDAITPYYDRTLKLARNAELARAASYRFCQCRLEDEKTVDLVADQIAPDCVVHLAAQPGVRYSIENPRAYIDSNIVGTFNLLEACRRYPPRHLLIASTSSVYGANQDFPFTETGDSDHPLTLYAATKKSVEAMAHAYTHLWTIPTTIVRLFTVYGPWGRPDMAIFKFVDNILNGRPIDIYNHGNIERDFTYIDDVVEALTRLSQVIPETGAPSVRGDSLSAAAPYRVINLAGHRPVKLLHFIEEIERSLSKRAIRNYMDAQAGDMIKTDAHTELAESLIGYRAATAITEGIPAFVSWYRGYYSV
jgi:UDP-glucuronate 4-epimerase